MKAGRVILLHFRLNLIKILFAYRTYEMAYGQKSFSYFLKIVIEGFHTSPTLFLLEFFQSAISITQSVIGLIEKFEGNL